MTVRHDVTGHSLHKSEPAVVCESVHSAAEKKALVTEDC
jgi:hypothetical protein